ncbi:hypothetical protein Taro_006100 [Colocasia esculenta]|uniref:Uncharacterized protein n=1 Tax=Colocasia esculenta TaxID=4460 RepID=A0A843TQ41_COLES|nr:hypothetical protein [Colocasia esculenta]
MYLFKSPMVSLNRHSFYRCSCLVIATSPHPPRRLIISAAIALIVFPRPGRHRLEGTYQPAPLQFLSPQTLQGLQAHRHWADCCNLHRARPAQSMPLLSTEKALSPTPALRPGRLQPDKDAAGTTSCPCMWTISSPNSPPRCPSRSSNPRSLSARCWWTRRQRRPKEQVVWSQQVRDCESWIIFESGQSRSRCIGGGSGKDRTRGPDQRNGRKRKGVVFFRCADSPAGGGGPKGRTVHSQVQGGDATPEGGRPPSVGWYPFLCSPLQEALTRTCFFTSIAQLHCGKPHRHCAFPLSAALGSSPRRPEARSLLSPEPSSDWSFVAVLADEGGEQHRRQGGEKNPRWNGTALDGRGGTPTVGEERALRN